MIRLRTRLLHYAQNIKNTKKGGGLHQTRRSTLKMLSGLTKALTNYLTHSHLTRGHVVIYTIENLMLCYTCNRSFITGPSHEVVKSIPRLHNIFVSAISSYPLVLLSYKLFSSFSTMLRTWKEILKMAGITVLGVSRLCCLLVSSRSALSILTKTKFYR
jgi:hypothetical protein